MADTPPTDPSRDSTPTQGPRGPRHRGKGGARKSGPGRGPSPMDVPLLERLVSLMSEHDLNSLELQDGDQRIHLTRGGMVMAAPAAPAAPAAAPSAAPPSSPAPAASSSAPAEDLTAGMVEIKSEMVGTFYAAPNPDADPFVKVGSTVSPTTDVCVIEAMKVFNTIQADTSGTIAKVLVENGQAVEFGQTLFLVKPA